MDSEDYKRFKKEIYDDFIISVKITRLSYRIDKRKVNDIIMKDPSVTLNRIKSDFSKYPLVKESIIDYNQVVLFAK
jgi:hypothetical protein